MGETKPEPSDLWGIRQRQDARRKGPDLGPRKSQARPSGSTSNALQPYLLWLASRAHFGEKDASPLPRLAI